MDARVVTRIQWNPTRIWRWIVPGVLLIASTATPALDIEGKIVSRPSLQYNAEGYGNFIILAKTGETIFTVTPDDTGAYLFDDLSAGSVSEIAWDQVAPGEHVLWPLWRQYRADASSYDFEVKSLTDLQKLAKVAVASALEANDMHGADRTLDRVLNIYASLNDEVRDTHEIARYEFVLLRDVITASALRRDVLGRSKVPMEMIDLERKWHRQLITSLSQRPDTAESTYTRVRRGVVAASNWSEFSRKAYRPQQKRWPALSIDDAADQGVELFLTDPKGDSKRYRDWMLEDVLLVRDFLRDPKLRQFVTKYRAEADRIDNGAVIAEFETVIAKEAGEIQIDRFMTLIDSLRALTARPQPEAVAAR
jgi:hypothetical protein